MEQKEEWSFEISAHAPWFDLHLKELWEYRGLIWMFVRRNFSTMYKQTILGPLWIFINPLLSTLTFTVVFGRIAHLPTQGVPDFIFYMSSNILWTLFASCLQKVSGTFVGNARLFGKVYFPRLSVPISNILTSFFIFLIQFGLYLVLLVYMMLRGNPIRPNALVLLVPMLWLEIGLLSLGLGTLISAITAKYHDLSVLVGFGLQLWMYASPVVYPVSMVPAEWRTAYLLNPMAPIIETFRAAFLGTGMVPWQFLLIGWVEILALLVLGLTVFGRVERTFLDTV